MVHIPRIKNKNDLLDALKCVHEDAGAFKLMTPSQLTHFSKLIREIEGGQ